MSFCKFSSQSIISEKTAVDNLFINEFLPSAPDNYVKIYIYGLYKCSNADSIDNTLESFSRVLGINEKEIEEAFLYWQEQGLVQIISSSPIEVRFLPLKNLFSNIKKYKPEKYQAFNIQVQEILTGRMLTPNEYAEYYNLIENERFEQEALLMLIKFCTNLKGNNVGYSYIVTVAKNWALENVVTAEKVEEKLKSLEHSGTNFGEIFKIFNIKRQASLEEREYWNKWKKEFEFEDGVILFVAKELKKKKSKLNFEKLNARLTKYFEMKLLSSAEIDAYESQRQMLFDTAIKVSSAMGLYYENLEAVVENYISRWTQMGYETDGLKIIADFCFKKSIRTLEGMNKIILKLFKLGLVSTKAIEQYVEELATSDSIIKKILEQLNLERNVNAWDRNYYATWKESWNITDELISYGAEIAKDKIQPVQYLNKILANFFESKVKTVQEAKKLQPPINNTAKDSPKMAALKGRSYSQKELNSFFDSIEGIEV